MQKTVAIIVLLTAVFFGLWSCSGEYMDPGLLEMMGGRVPGGGGDDKDTGGNNGNGGNNPGSGNPSGGNPGGDNPDTTPTAPSTTTATVIIKNQRDYALTYVRFLEGDTILLNGETISSNSEKSYEVPLRVATLKIGKSSLVSDIISINLNLVAGETVTFIFESRGGISKATAPIITTTTLPNGTVGTAYNQTFSATGDTPITWSDAPITWSIETGALPDGLTLSTAGLISGTPTTAGTINFTVKATNAAGNDTKSFSILVKLPFNDADGAANIGRIGPGGGIIFYYSETGFTLYVTYDDTVGITAHYLEAALTDAGKLSWERQFVPNIPGTGSAIGTGRKNTLRILEYANSPAAAIACSIGSGWFLPSTGELNQMYNQRSILGISTGIYWSSTQYWEQDSAYTIDFSDGKLGNDKKTYTRNVRAIRAF